MSGISLPMDVSSQVRIGCAGWSVASSLPPHPEADDASMLARYARYFNAVEINSSFYRLHQRSAYQRWAASVPADFRFAVKLPQAITHTARLQDCQAQLDIFWQTVSGLGQQLGCLLVQLPPSLAFVPETAARFFTDLRQLTHVAIACEPRHASWFADEQASQLLATCQVTRVAADPAPDGKLATAGDLSCVYYRLHGAPRMYYSSYDQPFLESLHTQICSQPLSPQVWIMFDNTAAGAALNNALMVKQLFSAEIS